MNITEVRIKLVDEPNERLLAFCSITVDGCFVIRDLKVIEGAHGPFVAMPSRKLAYHCSSCRSKNHLRAGYCNECGATLAPPEVPTDREGRAKLYADIAHPINSECRELIQDAVVAAYDEEVELAKQPGYVSRYDDIDEQHPTLPAPHAAGRRDASRTVDAGGGSHRENHAGGARRADPQQSEAPGPHHGRRSRGDAQQPAEDGFGEGVFEDL